MTFSIVFMGTPDFAVSSLRALVDAGHNICAVITNPDRPAGRGRHPKAPAVKEAALSLGITNIMQPKTMRDDKVFAQVQALQPDFFVVVAYGQILRTRYLEIPKFAPVNIHASLLPKYRGAAPIHWSIVRGEEETGVGIMKMERGMDTGGVYLSESIPIQTEDTAGSLHDRLASLGAALIVRALPDIATGALVDVTQDHSSATRAPMMSKADGALRFDESSKKVHDRARGMSPWPGAFCRFRGKLLKLIEVEQSASDGEIPADDVPPGSIVSIGKEGFEVACSTGRIHIRSVQPANKSVQSAQAFINGYRVKIGDLLEPDPRIEKRRD